MCGRMDGRTTPNLNPSDFVGGIIILIDRIGPVYPNNVVWEKKHYMLYHLKCHNEYSLQLTLVKANSCGDVNTHGII